jgi:hypothetical protein
MLIDVESELSQSGLREFFRPNLCPRIQTQALNRIFCRQFDRSPQGLSKVFRGHSQSK